MKFYICLVFAITLAFVSGQSVSPLWPKYFTAQWNLQYTTSSNEPPYGNYPPAPYKVGRGLTFYDSTVESMLEVYLDFCVPIFMNGSDWTCNFLNVNGISYLISDDPNRPDYVPDCCVFGDPWYPPQPNFLETSGAVQNVTSVIDCEPVEYWTIYLQDSGNFGYGFFANGTTDGWSQPASFYFAAAPLGWTIQNFFDFQVNQPIESTWTIPDSCSTAVSCPSM
ncbi:hypothetical protein DLAC_04047 [Tieghemostelium lacteum]|uniref:Uncharacterized protein n=1 Tax=Tieghemostelium lacteum TaxID=361077 RepID=A0A151ZS36_TIELA|nr:hypothetical protein DLAC_04047 [Tieghemostelium lacteum]|eukprot:KYQ96748.1 hypothetical protein DLAC_04047 [Tieghemostelium lacteum]